MLSTLLPRRSPWLFALCAALAAAGCNQKQDGAPAAGDSKAASSGAAGDVIKIGEYGSLTGSEATFGQSTHRGILMAIDEVNARGGVKGKKVEVISYDDRGNSQETGTAVTRLITNDKVTALLGEVASSLSLAGAAVAQQYGVPMISPASTNPQVTKKGDMIFRVCFIDTYQGYVCAKFMHDNLKAKNAAVLYDQTQAYSKGLKENFEKAFKELGGAIGTEQSFSGGDQDFSAQLTSLRDAKPDAIFLPAYYTDAGNIIAQARRLGITAPFVGGDGWDSAKLLDIGGAAMNGCYFSNHYSEADPRPVVVDFVKKYTTRWKETPDTMAALGYDAALILCDSMQRAQSLDGKALAAAIGQTKDYPGVTGSITIDPERNAQKVAVIIEIKNGKRGLLTTIAPK